MHLAVNLLCILREARVLKKMSDPCIHVEKIEKIKNGYGDMAERLDQMDERLKVIEVKVDKILEAIVPTLTPEQGIAFRLKALEGEQKKLEEDFIKRQGKREIILVLISVGTSSLFVGLAAYILRLLRF